MSPVDGTGSADLADFRPTHVAPIDGLATWTGPDFAEPSARLDPLLPLLAVDVRGDSTRVVCSNGWTAWVDGRLLVTLPHSPRGTTRPLAPAADPRPLLDRLEQALAHYREQVQDVTEGTIDLQTFRQLTRGLRLGLLLDGDAAWLLDLDRSRWVYYDGLQLHTYATVDDPDPNRDPNRDPHRSPNPDPDPDPGSRPAAASGGPPTWVPGDA